MYGNGGMNTYYRSVTNFGFMCTGANGVFCGAATGVNLSQMYLEADYARSFGPVSIGIAPVFAFQMFSAEGLGAFRSYSASPYNMTNNGGDNTIGVGLHAGLEWKVTPGFRIGVSGATPTWMQKNSKYQGLFADQGSFNIPGSVDAGVAWDVIPTVTLMADYKAIFYSGIPAIANSSNIMLPYGSTGGPGFGWSNVNVVAIGGEWRATPELTLRAGMQFNNNPVHGSDVTLGLVAPGVTTSEFSAGLSYRSVEELLDRSRGVLCAEGQRVRPRGDAARPDARQQHHRLPQRGSGDGRLDLPLRLGSAAAGQGEVLKRSAQQRRAGM